MTLHFCAHSNPKYYCMHPYKLEHSQNFQFFQYGQRCLHHQSMCSSHRSACYSFACTSRMREIAMYRNWYRNCRHSVRNIRRLARRKPSRWLREEQASNAWWRSASSYFKCEIQSDSRTGKQTGKRTWYVISSFLYQMSFLLPGGDVCKVLFLDLVIIFSTSRMPVI